MNIQANQIQGVLLKEIENHTCSICTSVPTLPYVLDNGTKESDACGHLYCQECIVRWSLQSSKCPDCRTSFTIANVKLDVRAKRRIEEWNVSCPYEGCVWIGKIGAKSSNYYAHEQTCERRPIDKPGDIDPFEMDENAILNDDDDDDDEASVDIPNIEDTFESDRNRMAKMITELLPPDVHMSKDGMKELIQTSENYLVSLMKRANNSAFKDKRFTVLPRDFSIK